MERNNPALQQRAASWLTLFSTTGTLICCALPILLVTFGLGAAFAALTQALPFLVTLALHKHWIFAASGLMLTVSAWLLYRRERVCPSDPELGRLCERAQRWNRRIFIISVVIWSIGAFSAYLALPIRIWLDS